MPPFCIVREMCVLVVLLVYAELGRVGFDDCKRNGFSDSGFCLAVFLSHPHPKVLKANRALEGRRYRSGEQARRSEVGTRAEVSKTVDCPTAFSTSRLQYMLLSSSH